jgi:hypothetical protein
MVRPSALSAAAALALTGCREKAAPPLAPPPAPATPAPQATPLRGDVGCTAPLDAPGAREKLREKKGELRIGALAGLKDADDDNVAWLKKLVAELKRRGAEVLIADGDLGDNPDEQETLLGALAESGLPVLAAAGNREVRSELDAAEAELRKKGARIVDLSHTRIVDLGDATIVGLPGASSGASSIPTAPASTWARTSTRSAPRWRSSRGRPRCWWPPCRPAGRMRARSTSAKDRTWATRA